MSVLNFCFRTNVFPKLGAAITIKINTKRPYATAKVHNMLKVTVCGALGRVGQPLCLMLKQCPLIDELAVYDIADTNSFATELSHVDTRCKVKPYSGINQIKKALVGSKIVVVVAAAPKTSNLPYSAMFTPNAEIVRGIVENFSLHCPKALLAIATNPVNSLVPLASEVLKANAVYNSNIVFGVTTIDIVRANSFVANVHALEPECVFVPVIGGHADKTIVPVLSKAEPTAEFTNEELEKITARIQNAHNDSIKPKSKSATLSCGFAISRFVVSLIKGMLRHSKVVEYAYVKSNAHPGAKYLSVPVRLGPGGIQKVYTLPSLSEYESCLLENAIPLIASDIIKGEQFARGIDTTECDSSKGEETTAASCPA